MNSAIFSHQITAMMDYMNLICSRASRDYHEESVQSSSALLDSRGRAIAISGKNPLLSAMLLNVNKLFDSEAKPEQGDILITNAPQTVGFHPNALLTVTPVASNDHETEPVYLAVSQWIHSIPVSFHDVSALTGRKDFCSLPPVKLIEDGELNNSIVNLMLANHGNADLLKNSLNAMLEALESGSGRCAELMRRWSREGFASHCQALLKRSRKAFSRLFLHRDEQQEQVLDFLELDSPKGAYQRVSAKIWHGSRNLKIRVETSASEQAAALRLSRSAILAAVMEALLDGTRLAPLLNHSFLEVFQLEFRGKGAVLSSYEQQGGPSIHFYQRIVDVVRASLFRSSKPDVMRFDFCAPARFIWLKGKETLLETLPPGRFVNGEYCMDARYSLFGHCRHASSELLEQQMPVSVFGAGYELDHGRAIDLLETPGIIRSLTTLGEARIRTIVDRTRYPAPFPSIGSSARNSLLQWNGNKMPSLASIRLKKQDLLTSSTAGHPERGASNKSEAGC